MGPRFLGTDFWIPVSSVPVFGIRFFGYEPKKPSPKNHLQKARTQKTVSAKPYPESRDPKTKGSEKGMVFGRRIFRLRFPARASDFCARFLGTRFFELRILQHGFFLQDYWIGFLGYGLGDSDTALRDSC